MKKNTAEVLVENFLKSKLSNTNRFTIEEEIHKEYLENFHEWADRKNHLGSFLVKDLEFNESFWFVFLEWNNNNPNVFYLIIFPQNRKGPLLELHKFENESLVWNYIPKKGDGRNVERKEYFKLYFGNTKAIISFPKNEIEMIEFIEDVFELIKNRQKADILSEDKPTFRSIFPEGRKIEKKHLIRERNSKLVQFVKEQFKQKYGKLFCEVCEFDFEKTYGDRGKDFIEAHHTRPISELDQDGSKTRPDELLLVCSNCHKIIHRTRPWLNPDDLKKLIKNKHGY